MGNELVNALRETLRLVRAERTNRRMGGLAPDKRLDTIENQVEETLLLAMLRARHNGLVLLPEDKT